MAGFNGFSSGFSI